MKSGASCNPRHPSMHARRERLQQQPAMTGVAPSARLLAAPRMMVKPATVIVWHRRGFRWYSTWKVRHGHAGRPSVPRETRELIRILSRNNSTQLAESLHRLKLALHHRYERVA